MTAQEELKQLRKLIAKGYGDKSCEWMIPALELKQIKELIAEGYWDESWKRLIPALEKEMQKHLEKQKFEQQRDEALVSTMEYKFSCPHCDQHIAVTPYHAGTTAKCPTCGKRLVVPDPPDKRSSEQGELAAPQGDSATPTSQSRIAGIVEWTKKKPKLVTEQRKRFGAVQAEGARRYMKHRRDTDPAFKLLQSLRSRLRSALKGAGKSRSTMELVGCSIVELTYHIEAQFRPGMSWENYGKWHVDHIIPCCAFDLTKPEQQRACFNFFNLQPLWGVENSKKVVHDMKQRPHLRKK